MAALHDESGGAVQRFLHQRPMSGKLGWIDRWGRAAFCVDIQRCAKVSPKVKRSNGDLRSIMINTLAQRAVVVTQELWAIIRSLVAVLFIFYQLNGGHKFAVRLFFFFFRALSTLPGCIRGKLRLASK